MCIFAGGSSIDPVRAMRFSCVCVKTNTRLLYTTHAINTIIMVDVRSVLVCFFRYCCCCYRFIRCRAATEVAALPGERRQATGAKKIKMRLMETSFGCFSPMPFRFRFLWVCCSLLSSKHMSQPHDVWYIVIHIRNEYMLLSVVAAHWK